MATIKELWQAAIDAVGEEELTRRFRLWITHLIRTARIKSAESADPSASSAGNDIFTQDVKLILSDLNHRTGSRFTATDQAKHLIRNLMAKGYITQDFLHVHEIKAAKWLSDPAMADYLRPSTLYRPSHFDEYLAEYYAMERQRSELAAKRAKALTRAQPLTSEGSNQPKALTSRNCSNQAQPLTSPQGSNHPTGIPPNIAAHERAALITELTATPWHAHPTFAALVLHTIKFPDPQSLASYQMPDRVRRMRTAPKMLTQILRGQSPQWAEDEFTKIKEDAKESPDA